MIISNTTIQKTTEQLATFKIPGTIGTAPWTADRFATADHFIRRHIWRCALKYIEMKTDRAFPSDHYLRVATVKIRFKKLAHAPPTPKQGLQNTSNTPIRCYIGHLQRHSRIPLKKASHSNAWRGCTFTPKLRDLGAGDAAYHTSESDSCGALRH